MLKKLFQKQCLPVWYTLFVCAVLLVSGCNRNTIASPDYDLGHPEVTLLGKVLNEISGITWCSTPDSALLAISDSKERVFLINMQMVKLEDYTENVVDKKADLEDLVKVDTSIYLLQSKGIIKEVPDKAKDSSAVKTYFLDLPGSNDFETMYHDPAANAVVLLCKACEHEKKGGIRTAYRFDLATKTFDSTPFFTISKDEVKTFLQDAGAKFDPSAAAIHPVNRRLYILSSAGNLLVVCDTKGKVIEAYNLDPDDFPQAEGIAFAPNGDMFITNEGKFGAPSLLRFPYQRAEKKK